ncbi:probable inactive receptor kinase At5g67200 [Magnolia sinica]|uniref:probable inactive receptor kinase At5g67200 n=1 Tax=Magnolia sinica TaxID=86752 RepID=UPI00265987EC|nr:probable inactive receptor kinase At5g67200 [Magnolia sinica]
MHEIHTLAFLSFLSLTFLFSLPLSSSSSPSAAPDALALLSFKALADKDNKLHFPLKNAYSHCQWPGVRCSVGRVVRLVFEGLPLRGTFAPNTLSRLDQLRVLSLQNNSLSGTIPNLSGLYNLKSLFLDHNVFSGIFPPSIFSLHRILTIDLSYNNLTGPIPVQLASLSRLYYLRLDSNRFNGTVPPLNQSYLKIFNVSFNNLSGAVPATILLSSFGASAFSGNPGLCGAIVHNQCRSELSFFSSTIAPAPPPTLPQNGLLQGLVLPPTSAPKKHKRAAVIILGFVAGILLLIGLFVVLSLLIKKLQRWKISARAMPAAAFSAASSHADDNASAASVVMSEVNVSKKMQGLQVGKSGSLVFCAGEPQVYTLEQLMRASAEMLGRGTIATTYKAVLDNQLIVSVKRLDASKAGAMSKEAFDRHMEAVGNLRHPNLVPLRAFFQAKEERLLIYDYEPNGSLFSLIHGSRSTRAKPLHWTSCLKIAEDVAQGLAYIHQASRLVHSNLKSSNILLGVEFEACIADYCLLALAESSSLDNADSGYRAPEIRKSNQPATPKSDVYSFGVLLLELLTGRPPLHQPFLVAADLTSWVRSVREEEESEDDRLAMLIDIGTACIQSSPEQRPSMWQVLKMIQVVKETEMGDNEMNSTELC